MGWGKLFKTHSFQETFFQGSNKDFHLDYCPCPYLVPFSHHFLTVFWSHSNVMLTSKILPGLITLIYMKKRGMSVFNNDLHYSWRNVKLYTSRCILQKSLKCKNDIVVVVWKTIVISIFHIDIFIRNRIQKTYWLTLIA